METSTEKPMISGSKSNGIDKISSLPVDVLHIILSYLCIFDVVQMSVLSKRWKYISITLPYFHFDLSSFYAERLRPLSCTTMEKFRDSLCSFLISKSTIKLVRFVLCCSDLYEKEDMLLLIHAATTRNVEELVLWFWLHRPFELPYCLATCESLQVLKLHLFGEVLKLPNHLRFSQLKSLHLEDAELSDDTSRLFSKCDLLEKLVLHSCILRYMTLLYISSASLLYLTISGGDDEENHSCEIKISCPRLKFLKYKAPVPKDIVINKLFSIEDVCIVTDYDRRSFEEIGILVHKMMKEVSSTSILKLCKASLKGLYEVARQVRLSPISFYKLKSLKMEVPISFYKLKSLKREVGVDEPFMQVMIRLLKYSPNLEVLKLWYQKYEEWSEHWQMHGEGSENWQMHDPEESIVCLDSHLKSIQLTGFKDKENEIELLRFFLTNARVLEKLTIVWACYDHKSEETSKEVLKIPRTSSHVLLTFLDPKHEPRSCNWYD